MNDNQELHVQFALPLPSSTPKNNSSEGDASTTSSNVTDCLKCHKQAITYECDPCGCPSFCDSCARKLASGGKCKTCNAFYGGLRRIRVPNEE